LRKSDANSRNETLFFRREVGYRQALGKGMRMGKRVQHIDRHPQLDPIWAMIAALDVIFPEMRISLTPELFEMHRKVGDGALHLLDQTIDGGENSLENIDRLAFTGRVAVILPSMLPVSKNR
jgi:hypothetical protein